MIAQVWPFLAEHPPLLVDWLPWNHTFGANHNFNMVLAHGGSLYVDGGRPLPGLIDETVRNLREVSPTLYFNVPAGFAQLLPRLESDLELRRNRSSAASSWSSTPAPPCRRTSGNGSKGSPKKELGRRVAMVSAWGSTETSPAATTVHFEIDRAGVIGLPLPGVEIKLVPSGGKQELRVRGPSVTPGYWNDEELTGPAFDEEGFYKIGDAGRLADEDDAGEGHRLRRPGGRGLQADLRNLGQRRRPAGGHPLRRAAAPRRRNLRPRPRLSSAPPRLAPARPLPLLPGLRRAQPSPRSPKIRQIRAEVAAALDAPQPRAPRLLDPHRPLPPARRAALDRPRRDHRQGLRQPRATLECRAADGELAEVSGQPAAQPGARARRAIQRPSYRRCLKGQALPCLAKAGGLRHLDLDCRRHGPERWWTKIPSNELREPWIPRSSDAGLPAQAASGAGVVSRAATITVNSGHRRATNSELHSPGSHHRREPERPVRRAAPGSAPQEAQVRPMRSSFERDFPAVPLGRQVERRSGARGGRSRHHPEPEPRRPGASI